jgi:hypothetical protein
MHGSFVDGDNTYFVLLPEIIGNEKFGKSFFTKFTLGKAAHLYDVRQGKYLGFGKNFNIQLFSGNGSMFASLPYKVNKVELKSATGAKAGYPLKVNATIIASNKAKNHVLNLTCFDPTGKEVKHYFNTVKTQSNSYNFTIPFAYNDKLGIWTIVVKDAASSIKATLKIKLTN